MFERIKALWLRYRLWSGEQRIIDHYKRSGHESPYTAAYREIMMRTDLEHVRDWASANWRAYDGHLGEIKKAAIDAIIKPKARIYTNQELASIRAAINVMESNELFHQEAEREWLAEIEAWAAERMKEAPPMSEQEMRVLLAR